MSVRVEAKPSTPSKQEPDAPRGRPAWRRVWDILLIPILAVFSALVIGALFIAFTDAEVYAAFREGFGRGLAAAWRSVAVAYGAMFAGSIGSPREVVSALQAYFASGATEPLILAFNPLSESLVASTPYIFAGLAVAVGFRGGLFNIGGEGQLWVAAGAAVVIGYSFLLPWWLHLPFAIAGGILAGAIYGAIPGYLKAKTGAHEVINTIMMNYIAFRFFDWAFTGILRRPGGDRPITAEILPTAYLPRLFPDPMRFHVGFFLALLAAFAVWWLLFKTTIGFEIRTVGTNPDAARYGGIKVTRIFVLTMFISGGLAGMTGVNEVLGVNRYLAGGFSAGYGFDAIALALLGKSHPLGVVLASLLFGTLRNGATRMQSIAQIPIDIISIVQALIIVFIAAPALVRWIYRVKAETDLGEAVFTRGWGS
ncbi:MAG: ABC transporter permease [Anaerolineae bacterium]